MPDIVVQLPGGGTARFPEGTSQDVMTKALTEMSSPSSTTTTPTGAATDTAPQPDQSSQAAPAVPSGQAALPYDWNTAPEWQKQAWTAGTHFGQGALSNVADEVGAYLRAKAPELSNWMMQPSVFEQKYGDAKPSGTVSTAPTTPFYDLFSKDPRYTEELAKMRAGLGTTAAAFPETAQAANIAGQVAQAVVTPTGRIIGAAETIPGKALLGGLTFGAQGGIAGFGQGTGGLENRLEAAKVPAAIGAVTGVASPFLEPFVNAGASYLAKPFTQRTGEILADLPTVTNPQGQKAIIDPIAGSNATQRQAALQIAQDLQAGGRFGNDPATVGKIATALDEQGSSATLAGIDPNLARRARDAYILPGEGAKTIDESLKATRAAQGGYLREAIGPTPPYPQLVDEAAAAQQQLGPKIYDPALRGNIPLNVSSDMQTLRNLQLGNTNPVLDAERKAIISLKVHPRNVLNQNYVPTPAEVAHRVTSEITDPSLAGSWKQALYAANPHIQAADQAYAAAGGVGREIQSAKDWMKAGLSDEAQAFSPYALARDQPQMSAAELQGQRDAARNVMIDKTTSLKGTRQLADALIGSDPQLGLQARLGLIDPQNLPKVMREAQGIKDFQAMERRVAGGSPERAGDIGAAQPRLSGIADPRDWSARILDWLGESVTKMRNPNAAVRNELAQRLVTTDPQKQLETLALGRALSNQRPLPGFATYAPAAGIGAATQYVNPQVLPRR
jgi:hypothetical protein